MKSIAASADLPDEIRRGVSRPDLPEDERAALHNVTSGLYNREPVKQAVDRAIATACASLGVAAPGKKGGKRAREGKKERGGGEDGPEDRIPVKKAKLQAETTATATAAEEREQVDVEMGGQVAGGEGNGEEEEEVTDFEGFESDVDEPGPAIGDPGSEDEAADEKQISKYDHLLGSSSDEDDDDDGEDSEGSGWDEELLAKYRGRETVNLDDISVSGGSEGEGEEEEESQGSESDVEEDATWQLSLSSSSSSSRSASPLPVKKDDKTKKKHRERREPVPTRAGETTFLPSLMGGYVSGSESASDVEAEVAPAKKRRGQRARQAIWEKKFGAKARHLQEQQAGKGKGKGKGRDSGWDMRRGAVDGDDDARTPWKRGVRTPFGTGGGGGGNGGGQTAAPTPKPTKRDDEGKLHGSWEAAKKAKEAQKAAVFAGSKVTFD